jgi:hypothetical protein
MGHALNLETDNNSGVWSHTSCTIRELSNRYSSPTRHHGSAGERGGIAHSRPSTRWGEWSASSPGRDLAPGKGPPSPFEQKAWWASAGLDTEATGKSLLPLTGSNLDRPDVLSVVRHYTDWTIRLSREMSRPHKTRTWTASLTCWL